MATTHMNGHAHVVSATPVPDAADDELMHKYITDRRVVGYDPLIQPALIRHELPLPPTTQAMVAKSRFAASRIIAGQDDRLIVIVGPCSIHNPDQAFEYAKLLQGEIEKGRWDGLLIVMRAYFEKPRTTTGWKGLINDPLLNGTYSINRGLRLARSLLLRITALGLPVGSELLDTISPQYLSDTLTWGAIGARTTESQLHRELASGCSFPIGFKNATSGDTGVAVDALRAASSEHAFMGVTESGMASIVRTRGNRDVHVILRGGKNGPNYYKENVVEAKERMEKDRKGEWPGVMIDCSHGNSQKNHLNQPKVLHNICEQLTAPVPSFSSSVPAQHSIIGIMIESNIHAGRQDLPNPTAEDMDEANNTFEKGSAVAKKLKYGVSVTDACVDWEMTLDMLDEVNEAVKKRRAIKVETQLAANMKLNKINEEE